MKTPTQVTYARTLPDVRAYFRKGITDVLLFFPKEERSVRINRDNYKRVAARFRKVNRNGKR